MSDFLTEDPRRIDLSAEMSTPILIPLPWQRPPLMSNDRRKWVVQWREFQAAKEQACWAIRAALPTPRPRIERCEVELHWQVGDNRRRDADGPMPTMKVTLDALVETGVIRDDNFQIVPRVSSQIHPPERKQKPRMWLEITPLPDPASAGSVSFQEH